MLKASNVYSKVNVQFEFDTKGVVHRLRGKYHL